MNETSHNLQEAVDWLKKEFTAIRTGQASPALLDALTVESYGTFMPLNQVASIGVEDARTLRISPWDISLIRPIEKALQESDLGVSAATDSAGVRAIFPELTAERRTQLQKLAKSKLEDARITVRGVRDDAMKQIDKLEKDGEISEDEKFDKKDEMQKKVQATNSTLESMFDNKEAELAA